MGRNTPVKNEQARQRLEDWYQRFHDKIEAPAESHEISTSYGINHLLIAGNPSKPPLISLHAMLTSSAHLLSEMNPLLDHFQLIAPDIPGQSVRGIPKRLSYNDASHAEWLEEILDALNLDKINLFGVSLGGFAARQFAVAHPERVNNLMLLVPAGIVQGSIFKGLAKMALPMLMYKISPSDNRLRNLVKNLITTWDEDWAHYLGDAFNDFAVPSGIPPVASDEELNSLIMPCLVMAAEKDISFPGIPLLERVESQVPNVETELITDSRHCPPTTLEFQQWLADRVVKFVTK